VSRVIARVRARRPETSMVRRGSTVRVRQRALHRPCKQELLRSNPLAKLPACIKHGADYGAFRSRKPSIALPAARTYSLTREQERREIAFGAVCVVVELRRRNPVPEVSEQDADAVGTA
jgi:hypothetical protein